MRERGLDEDNSIPRTKGKGFRENVKGEDDLTCSKITNIQTDNFEKPSYNLIDSVSCKTNIVCFATYESISLSPNCEK